MGYSVWALPYTSTPYNSTPFPACHTSFWQNLLTFLTAGCTFACICPEKDTEKALCLSRSQRPFCMDAHFHALGDGARDHAALHDGKALFQHLGILVLHLNLHIELNAGEP